ncbi:hypothetical protein BDV19DRAFT_360871 [Aspergillus venezuelensis]
MFCPEVYGPSDSVSGVTSVPHQPEPSLLHREAPPSRQKQMAALRLLPRHYSP